MNIKTYMARNIGAVQLWGSESHAHGGLADEATLPVLQVKDVLPAPCLNDVHMPPMRTRMGSNPRLNYDGVFVNYEFTNRFYLTHGFESCTFWPMQNPQSTIIPPFPGELLHSFAGLHTRRGIFMHDKSTYTHSTLRHTRSLSGIIYVPSSSQKAPKTANLCVSGLFLANLPHSLPHPLSSLFFAHPVIVLKKACL